MQQTNLTGVNVSMSELTKRLHDERLTLLTEARALNDKVASEQRDFNAEETATWTALNGRIDALGSRMTAEQELETRVAETERAFEAHTSKRVEHATQDNDQVNAELRSFLDGSGPRTYTAMADGAPTTFRDLAKGAGSTGGYTVPVTLYKRLWEYLIETSGILQLNPTLLNTSGGESIDIPVVNDHGLAAVVAEAAPIPEDDPVFAKVTLGAIKYGKLIQISTELVDDSVFDLTEYLARSTGRALGNKFGAAVTAVAIAGSTEGATAFDDVSFGTQSTAGQGFDTLIDLYHSVLSPYRNSASAGWLLNDSTAAMVRKLKNADGIYAWQPAVTVGAPDLILGKPVRIDPNVASAAVDAKTIIFGDWSALFVRTAGGVRFERSDDYAFNTDQVTFRGLLRGDAAVVDTGALKHLAMAAA